MSTQASACEELEVAAEVMPESELMRELASDPSERDRRVYEAVLVRRRDPEEVGREFGLAAATVLNIARWTHKRLAESAHVLLGMSPMEVLILRYDRLQWQSRELDRAWEMSSADRHVTDKIVTTVRKSDGTEQTVSRDVTRMLHSKGPDPRYQRLRDQLDDKLHAVIQEVQELKAKASEEIARKLRIEEQAKQRAAEAANPDLAQARREAERAEFEAVRVSSGMAAEVADRAARGEVVDEDWIKTEEGEWIGKIVDHGPRKRKPTREEQRFRELEKEVREDLRATDRMLARLKAVSKSPQSSAGTAVTAPQVAASNQAT